MASAKESVGLMTVQILCADIPGLLYAAAANGIVFHSVEQIDLLSVETQVHRKDYYELKKYVKRWGGEIRVVSGGKSRRILTHVLSRPILLFAAAGLLLLSLWLPNCILFVEIEGNEAIPTNKILEAANNCGITFGASRRNVRSENMKNRLLESVPELQWAGINTYGCRAVISVKERNAQNFEQGNDSVSSIVAERDGFIESCTATKGTLLCKPGQVVKKGEVLISGYTDCGMTIRATAASGEVFAKTSRQITVIIPTDYVLKSKSASKYKRISIMIGKKRINLLNDSGNYSTSCVKIYNDYPLLLPGGLQLPLGFSVEETNGIPIMDAQEDAWLDETAAVAFAEAYLRSQMICGVILDKSSKIVDNGDALIFYGQYLCSEMIGRVQYEGIANINGKDN